MVVQDSYYKELHNDVALIAAQMADIAGMSLELRRDFASIKNMAGLNGRSKIYRKTNHATESVLCFVRE